MTWLTAIHEPASQRLVDSPVTADEREQDLASSAAALRAARVDGEDEVVAFLAGRSAPCPKCGYDLKDIQTPRCPECAEPLVLRVGSPRARFGWLIVAIAPGCFSGVAAVFVLVPITLTMIRNVPGQRVPWPVMIADAFGFLSAAGVLVMYQHRQRVMSWPARKQAWLAGGVWGVHILAFALFVLGMVYFA